MLQARLGVSEVAAFLAHFEQTASALRLCGGPWLSGLRNIEQHSSIRMSPEQSDDCRAAADRAYAATMLAARTSAPPHVVRGSLRGDHQQRAARQDHPRGSERGIRFGGAATKHRLSMWRQIRDRFTNRRRASLPTIQALARDLSGYCGGGASRTIDGQQEAGEVCRNSIPARSAQDAVRACGRRCTPDRNAGIRAEPEAGARSPRGADPRHASQLGSRVHCGSALGASDSSRATRGHQDGDSAIQEAGTTSLRPVRAGRRRSPGQRMR